MQKRRKVHSRHSIVKVKKKKKAEKHRQKEYLKITKKKSS